MFDWIKKLFKSDKSDDNDYELLSAKPIASIKLDEPTSDEVSTELNVENRAIGFGKDNKPAPDATEYDPNAKAIIIKFTKARTNNVSKLSKAIFYNQTIAKKCRDVEKSHKIERIPDKAKGKINLQKYVGIWNNINSKIKTSNKNLEIFRFKNHRSVDADYLDSFILHWSIFALIVLFETIANAFFFRDALKGGALEGVTISFFITFINAGFSFYTSNYAFRLTNHIKKSKRYVGWAVVALYLPVILFWNLYIAHFRTVFTEYEKVGKTINVNEISMAVFPHMSNLGNISQTGLALFFVGLIVCTGIFLKCYIADDPYPGYGKISRKKDEVIYKRDYFREEEWPTWVDSIYDKAFKSLNIIENQLDKILITWGDFIEVIEHLISSHKAMVKNIELNINLTLKIYNTLNLGTRTDKKKPNIFKKEYSAKIEPEEEYHESLKDVKEATNTKYKEVLRKKMKNSIKKSSEKTNKKLVADQEKFKNYFAETKHRASPDSKPPKSPKVSNAKNVKQKKRNKAKLASAKIIKLNK